VVAQIGDDDNLRVIDQQHYIAADAELKQLKLVKASEATICSAAFSIRLTLRH